MNAKPDRRIRVAVLHGGASAEHVISRRSGRQVLKSLDPERYLPTGVLINEKNEWAFLEPGNLDADAKTLEGWVTPGRAVDMLLHFKADVVFIALHGPNGEDGTVQGLLELHGLPYTGSRVAASAIAMNKALSRAVFRDAGLLVAQGAVVTRSDWKRGAEIALTSLEKKVRGPWFVKPASLGSSVGVRPAKNRTELKGAIEEALAHDENALVETEIAGTEVTCAVLGNAGSELQPLPPIEIVPKPGRFFDFEEKYSERGAEEICPPRSLDASDVAKIQEVACIAHRALGCDGMSRIDMIVSREGVVVLEANTIPGLTERSLLPRAAAAEGISFPALLDRLIALALQRFSAREVKS